MQNKKIVKIDKLSIKKNPNAGQTGYHIPGIQTIEYEYKGDILPEELCDGKNGVLHTPKYLYKYEDTVVTCNKCGNEVIWHEIPLIGDFDALGYCPECYATGSFDYEFESISDCIVDNKITI